MPIEVVFLGAKGIGTFCLQYLISYSRQNPEKLRVIAVRSRKTKAGEGIISIAERHKIPVLEHLDELPSCDLIYSVQHHELLKERHIAKASKGAVNLHLAPLPEYRGCNQFSFAIMDEVKEFGVTIHQIDTQIDHGAILFEKRFPIPKDVWVKDLVDLAIIKGEDLFVETLPNLISGNYQPISKPGAIKGERSVLHYRKEIDDLKNIPLGLSKDQIQKRIRATLMPGFEPPYTIIGEEKIYFTRNPKDF